MDVVDEQLDTIGKALLAQTLGCARCHDHKFDPIPTKDYYALAGIFKSTQTLIHDNVSRWVEAPLPVATEQQAAVEKHEAAVAALKQRIDEAKAGEKRTGTVPNAGIVAAASFPGVVIDDTQAKRVGEWTKSTYAKNYIGEGYLHDGNTGKGTKTLTFTPKLPQAGRYEVRIAYPAGGNRATKIPVFVLHQDGEFTGVVNEQVTPHIDGRFVSVGTFRFDTTDKWYVIISNEGTTGHVCVDAVQFIPEEMAKEQKGKKDAPKAKPMKGDSRALEAELKKLIASGPERPMAMVVKEATKIDDCNICIRGNIRNVGDKVSRGFLQVATTGAMPSIPAKESGRRELAAWLASADNPLTARVMANRLWHYLHSSGIVPSVDVFGVTGDLPSNPALLDHLALRFVNQGWSMKKLIREIVLSRSYQLSSEWNPRFGDPENRLYGRHARRRLEAEEIRDTILLVSGKLESTLGGPNWKRGTTSEVGYKFDDTRRSVYTPIFRNRLLELFEAFDFADPNLVVGRRNVSTVATQALFLMNHPFVMEQAGYAAKAALAEDVANDTVRVDRAYRRTLGRLPTDREREIVMKTVGGTMTPAERQAAWERLYQALFSSIDFRYVN
jgi:hypothetical protein